MASPSPDAASSDATTPPASVDLYRDTPVRFLGSANELGESFKPLIPRVAYFGTYGVACAYVAADANENHGMDDDASRGDEWLSSTIRAHSSPAGRDASGRAPARRATHRGATRE